MFYDHFNQGVAEHLKVSIQAKAPSGEKSPKNSDTYLRKDGLSWNLSVLSSDKAIATKRDRIHASEVQMLAALRRAELKCLSQIPNG